MLYTAHDLAERLDAEVEPALNDAPDRPRDRTQNHEGIAGAAAAVTFLANLTAGGGRRERLVRAMTTPAERGDGLVARLWNGLRALDGVTVYGPAPSQPRTSTIVLTVGQQPSVDVTRALVERGLSPARRLLTRPHRASSWTQKSRDSCAWDACYTTEEEVERVLEGVAAIAR